jgi:hypothetical protein
MYGLPVTLFPHATHSVKLALLYPHHQPGRILLKDFTKLQMPSQEMGSAAEKVTRTPIQSQHATGDVGSGLHGWTATEQFDSKAVCGLFRVIATGGDADWWRKQGWRGISLSGAESPQTYIAYIAVAAGKMTLISQDQRVDSGKHESTLTMRTFDIAANSLVGPDSVRYIGNPVGRFDTRDPAHLGAESPPGFWEGVPVACADVTEDGRTYGELPVHTTKDALHGFVDAMNQHIAEQNTAVGYKGDGTSLKHEIYRIIYTDQGTNEEDERSAKTREFRGIFTRGEPVMKSYTLHPPPGENYDSCTGIIAGSYVLAFRG